MRISWLSILLFAACSSVLDRVDFQPEPLDIPSGICAEAAFGEIKIGLAEVDRLVIASDNQSAAMLYNELYEKYLQADENYIFLKAAALKLRQTLAQMRQNATDKGLFDKKFSKKITAVEMLIDNCELIEAKKSVDLIDKLLY
jgi:hypothetical protein